MPILHKNITNSTDIHNPKWLSTANNGDYAWKNEKGELESIDEIVLPAALNFVDASVAPPTSNNGDIYILSSGGSVNAGWGSVAVGDWVRYDGALWNSITPQKSTLCYDETADNLNSFDGSAWSAIGGSSGVVGIANALGEYTYYDTITLALASSVSGDTISLFTNIVETGNVSITCVNGVNINFNGFTYTLDSSGGSNAFSIPNGVSCSLINGKIMRKGGTNSLGAWLAIRISCNNVLNCVGMTFESDFGVAARIENSATRVIGGLFIGHNTGVYVTNLGHLLNAAGKSTTSYGIYIANNGTIVNCDGFSISNYGINNNNSNAKNSTGRSLGSVGFLAGGGNTYECDGYSTASSGLSLSASSRFANVFGHSTAAEGVAFKGNGINVVGYSTASYGVRFSSGFGSYVASSVKAFSTSFTSMYISCGAGKIEFSNVDISTTFNSSSGHGLTVVSSGGNIILSGGSIRVNDSSANCINATTSQSLFFTGLNFSNSTTAVNANITNSQTNTPDSFGNILIG